MENLNKFLQAELHKLGQLQEPTFSVDFLLLAVENCRKYKVISLIAAVGLGLAALLIGWINGVSGAMGGYLLSMAGTAVVLQFVHGRLAKKELIYKIMLLNRVSHRPKPVMTFRKTKRNQELSRPKAVDVNKI